LVEYFVQQQPSLVVGSTTNYLDLLSVLRELRPEEFDAFFSGRGRDFRWQLEMYRKLRHIGPNVRGLIRKFVPRQI